jgi:hypothetical protein
MRYRGHKFTRSSFLPSEVLDLTEVEPNYERCKILYFREVEENSLRVRNILKLSGIDPKMKNFDGRNYFYYEDLSRNVSVEANKLYIAVSWKRAGPEGIIQDLEMVGDLTENPPNRMRGFVDKRFELFWLGENLAKKVNAWPE